MVPNARPPSPNRAAQNASATGGGPGPLITALTSRYASKVTVPMTIVPGTMDDEALERVT